ncbi:MAG: amino acid racemase [Candidatus Aenigmarchaeota archaeon]|nr:amino acid racemase [Candidatus Aenigmarchaeota archaeon]
MKTIGIIGGMGPEATARFYMEIIRLFQRKYAATNDSDYPKMFICNLPIPDVLYDLENEVGVREMLLTAARKLESCSCEFIAIPCNSVQVFIKDLRSSVGIPVINIVEETARFLKDRNFAKVGIMGTETTVRSRLYEQALEPFGISSVPVTTLEQKDISGIIESTMAGRRSMADVEIIASIAKRMCTEGAQCIVLGCTELPLLDLCMPEIQFIDTIKVLAQVTVNRATEYQSKGFNLGSQL